MRLLITGGSGFIGKNLVEYFSKRYSVLAPTHAQLDLTDETSVEAYLRENKADIVIHGAVRPGHRNAKDTSDQLKINTKMFFSLARNKAYFKKMIFLNSGLVYDQRYYRPKMKEEYFGTYIPNDEAGLSKYIISKAIEETDNIYDLRLLGVFGKHEDYAIRFISNAICKALFGIPITLKQNRRFDYLYIRDLMPVLEYFIAHDTKYKAYNVTPDQSIELLALAEMVRKTSGKNIPIQVAQPGMGLEYSADNSRLRSEIKALKLTPHDVAIAELYDWYRSNKANIDINLLLTDK